VTGVSRAVGALLAIAATVGLSRASSMPFSPHGEQAVLRLAWTARPERIEDCRQRSDDELRKLPPHMRQLMSCTGTSATYHLDVRWNDRVIAQQTIRGGGLRHDRPLYLFRNIDLPPGDATIRVAFQRVESVTGNTRTGEEAVPPSLLLERHLALKSRKVVLVTYDAEQRDLVIVEDVRR
jgi:hypothetical protein